MQHCKSRSLFNDAPGRVGAVFTGRRRRALPKKLANGQELSNKVAKRDVRVGPDLARHFVSRTNVTVCR